jgi:serine kinase of HPr protein (carbohydrate metabolism regulator)
MSAPDGSPANIHATCVMLARAGKAFGVPVTTGVLLLGKSGAGKSDLALRLIERGALLVADDRTLIAIERGHLVARAPETIAGLLEVRGLGVVKLPAAPKVRVSLVVALASRVARIPERGTWTPPFTLVAERRPPLLTLNPFEPSAPAKVVLAAAAFAKRLFREDVKRR